MARRSPRRYSVPDEVEDGGGSMTGTALRRASKDTQKKVMREWFYENYRNPVDCCPHDSGEGGYQFLWGQYDAEEELRQEFEDVAQLDAIKELGKELWNISAEWSGQDDPPEDIDDYYFESLARSSGHLGEFEKSILDVHLLTAVSVEGSHQQCLTRLLYVNVITALEAYLSDFFSSAITQHSELKRRFVETNPDFRGQKMALSEVYGAWENLDAKVKETLVDIVWHHLAKVKPMFLSVLGVKFPDDMDGLFKAVQVRHDIVHRNGKKKDGGEHALENKDVDGLIAMAETLVKHIEGEWAKVRPGQAAEPVIEI